MIQFILLCSFMTADGGIYWGQGNIDTMFFHGADTKVIIQGWHGSDMSLKRKGNEIYKFSDCKVVKK